MKGHILLIGALFFLCAKLSEAAIFYVSTNGSDSNPGTLAQPWQTLRHAVAAMAGGDTVNVRAGTYSGTGFQNITPPAGDSTHYTTIQGYAGDAMPVIDAAAAAGSSANVFLLGTQYVAIRGLHIKGGGGNESGNINIGNNSAAAHIIIDGNVISDANVGGSTNLYNPAQIRIVYDAPADSITITNNEITGAYGSGIKMDGRMATNVLIKNNNIHDVLHGIAIKWGTATDQNITLSYNKIYNTSERGFYIDQGYVRIEHNVVYNTAASALYADDNFNGNNLKISHNTFAACLAGGIYLNPPTAVNNTIIDNIFYNCNGSFVTIAFWPYTIGAHNTATNYNGVFDAASSVVYRDGSGSYTIAQWKLLNGSDNSSLQADPSFINPAGNDFRLGSASPFKNAASDGTDMGAQICAVGVNASCSPPANSPANECANPPSGAIWCDDFETNQLNRYFDYNSNNGSFTLTGGAGVNGSAGMRAIYQPGQSSAGGLSLAFGRNPVTSTLIDAGTAYYREIYWRLYVKNQAGWTGGGGDKFSRAIVFASSNWSEAAIGHVWSGGGGTGDPNYLILDPASGTDASGNLVTTTYNDFAHLTWIGFQQGTTPLFNSANVGQWHCVEAHMKLNDAGSANGVFEFWVDGALNAQKTGLNWLGAYNSYGINAILFENYWNNTAPVVEERYFDNIVVSTQRIGCLQVSSSPLPPAAPGGLKLQ